MKKAFPLLLIYLVAAHVSFSQNVGIGNTTPLAKLDLNGDLALRSADLNIVSTYTYSLDINTVKQSNYKLKAAPSLGNFILAGIAAGTNGRMITLTNRTGSSMEIYNEDATANADDRIQTGTGGTLAVFPNGSVTLQYDVPEQRWLIKTGHNNSLNYFGGGGGGTSYWDLSGANISNNNTGNVGIGTTSPSYKLSVAGTTALTGPPLVSGSSGYLSGGGLLYLKNNTDGYTLNMDAGKIQAEKPKPFPQSGTSASVLSINPYGGNVGIGLTVPRCRLTVLSNTLLGNNTEVLQVAGRNPMTIFSDAGGNDFGYIKAITDRSQTNQFNREGLEIGTGGGDIYLTAQGYQPALMVNGTNNNVGIGFNVPNSSDYKLSIKGKVRCQEVTVELANWADYVFDDGYQLPTLESVEKHIKENKHLPGIPSAASIQKDGLSVGAVQTKMMEKIEELMLYVIELKKDKDALQERVKRLEEKQNAD